MTFLPADNCVAPASLFTFVAKALLKDKAKRFGILWAFWLII